MSARMRFFSSWRFLGDLTVRVPHSLWNENVVASCQPLLEAYWTCQFVCGPLLCSQSLAGVVPYVSLGVRRVRTSQFFETRAGARMRPRADDVPVIIFRRYLVDRFSATQVGAVWTRSRIYAFLLSGLGFFAKFKNADIDAFDLSFLFFRLIVFHI